MGIYGMATQQLEMCLISGSESIPLDSDPLPVGGQEIRNATPQETSFIIVPYKLQNHNSSVITLQ